MKQRDLEIRRCWPFWDGVVTWLFQGLSLLSDLQIGRSQGHGGWITWEILSNEPPFRIQPSGCAGRRCSAAFCKCVIFCFPYDKKETLRIISSIVYTRFTYHILSFIFIFFGSLKPRSIFSLPFFVDRKLFRPLLSPLSTLSDPVEGVD